MKLYLLITLLVSSAPAWANNTPKQPLDWSVVFPAFMLIAIAVGFYLFFRYEKANKSEQ